MVHDCSFGRSRNYINTCIYLYFYLMLHNYLWIYVQNFKIVMLILKNVVNFSPLALSKLLSQFYYHLYNSTSLCSSMKHWKINIFIISTNLKKKNKSIFFLIKLYIYKRYKKKMTITNSKNMRSTTSFLATF